MKLRFRNSVYDFNIMLSQNNQSKGGVTMVVLPQETLDEIMEVVHRAVAHRAQVYAFCAVHLAQRDHVQGAASKPADEWLTSEEARKILGVSSKTWQNYRDQGVIPFSQTGRKIYVLRSDLDNYLKSHRIKRR